MSACPVVVCLVLPVGRFSADHLRRPTFPGSFFLFCLDVYKRQQRVCTPEESGIVNLPRYRARSIPGTGALLRPEDRGEEQLTLL